MWRQLLLDTFFLVLIFESCKISKKKEQAERQGEGKKGRRIIQETSVQFNSVTQSCLTFCDPMDCSTLGFSVHHQLQSLLKLMSIMLVMPSNHLILCHPISSYLQSFPASGSFPMSQLFASGGQSIGVSASALVLSTNFQDAYPLGLTGWISLQSKRLSTPQFKSIDSWRLSFLYSPTLTSIYDYWKNHSLD